jgi:hypothetical protein
MAEVFSTGDLFSRRFGNAPTLLVPGPLLEEHKHRCQNDTIVPHRPSTCASTTSAWGSQKVMSMAR